MNRQSAVLVWPQVFILSADNSVTHPPLDIFGLVKAGMENALAADSHAVTLADDAIAQMQELLSSDGADLDRARATIQTAVSNLVVIDQALSAGASREEIRALVTAAQAFEDLPPLCSQRRHLRQRTDEAACRHVVGGANNGSRRPDSVPAPGDVA